MEELTPRRVVEELDRYIIGQGDGKKAVAIALRNRWRRQRLPDDLRDEVLPKNILMIGPTGVGKTEIARRLARLAQAPFVKVEASKFTEVGYVGRDVESMIRDLTELAINMVKSEYMATVREKAAAHAEDRVLDLLLPRTRAPEQAFVGSLAVPETGTSDVSAGVQDTREKLRIRLREGRLDDRFVEIEVKEKSMPFGVISNIGMEEMERNLKEMLGNVLPERSKQRKVRVPEALRIFTEEEAARLVDMDKVTQEALRRTEQTGIVFIDEIDKVAGRNGGHGPDVSREGVQRDLLPIVEGSTVSTKHGPVQTDHILFIAAGAFHVAKPSDLIPELQGRFPIRVELGSLGKEEFVRILTEPKNALIKQYMALLATESVELRFETEAIRRIAEISEEVNEQTENIGARRLQTVLEKLLEEVSFTAPDRAGEEVVIDVRTVNGVLSDIVGNRDLSRYIL